MNEKLTREERAKEEEKIGDEKLLKHIRALEPWDTDMKAMGGAKKYQHPTNDSLQPWLWTCRLYACVPESACAVDEVGKPVEKDEVGCRVRTS
jgi:hypothetical protein